MLIFKIDYYVPGISIPIIGYEVYHPNKKEKLDIQKYCKDTLIGFDIPVSIDENNLFKYDPNSEYYTNECFTYTSDNGTDIILNDRKEEYISNNLSLCENNCVYNEYNINSKKVSCECEIKSNDFTIESISEEKNILANNLTFSNSTSNIVAMKCIYTLFTKDGLLTNYGSYIILLIIIIFIILIILYFKFGIYLIEKDIKAIILQKKNNKNIFCKSKIERKEKKKIKKPKKNIF